MAPCYHPLNGWEHPEIRTKDGKKKIYFFKKPGPYPGMVACPVPCGQCRGCRHARALEWAIRGTHEASLYESNLFITLTFDDKKRRYNKSLKKSDFQKFLKRLRKKFYGNTKSNIRYLHCGEYGEKLGRPHHHAILFNFDFPDKKIWNLDKGLYTSAILSKLWPYGHHAIGYASFESIFYVARYVLKKITGELAPGHYQGRIPEYNTMSRRPGIAREWYEKYKNTDVFPRDFIVLNGMKLKVPKYYSTQYELTNPQEYATLKDMRIQKAKVNPNNHPDRLKAAEKIQIAKDNQIKRKFESGENNA